MKAIIKFLHIHHRIKESQKIGYATVRKVLKDSIIGKPFVVTQDIEAGDEVIDIETGKTFIPDIVNKNIPVPSNHFKILGEVSPEAAEFVVDGKEYELQTADNGVIVTYISPVGISLGKFYYKVQCETCKTYH